MKDIAILGAGGLAKEVAFLIEEVNKDIPTAEWRILGFIDDTEDKIGSFNGKYQVIADEESFLKWEDEISVAIAIGNPDKIGKIYSRLSVRANTRFPNIIHPATIMDFERVALGRGNIIFAGNLFTTDIEVGDCNIFNPGSTYGHDIYIGNCCVFNPGVRISGGVSVHNSCLIGAGATVLQYLTVNRHSTVGAGAVVTESVGEFKTVVGVPAKPLYT